MFNSVTYITKHNSNHGLLPVMRLGLFQNETILGEDEEGDVGGSAWGRKPGAGKLAVSEHLLRAGTFPWR